MLKLRVESESAQAQCHSYTAHCCYAITPLLTCIQSSLLPA